MSEYIKREDVENIMLGSCDENALWKLRHIPPADVVEVVRCKDCIYNDRGWCGSQEYGTRHVEDNDFCSQGEERQ